jgi:biopolymer transport protein ExbB
MSINQLVKVFNDGGIVMWPLLLLSTVAIALIAERIVFWRRVLLRQRRVAQDVLTLYQENNAEAAVEKLRRNLDLPIARIFLAALQVDRAHPDRFRMALETEDQAEIPVMKRFSDIFDTIVALSPLLGLLGTVLGLITSFASLTLGDVGGTRTLGVTGGISEALVSTAAGMVVALLTLAFAGVFRSLYIREIAAMREACGRLELLHSDRYAEREASYAISR